MSILTPESVKVLRESSKDDAAFMTLVALFEDTLNQHVLGLVRSVLQEGESRFRTIFETTSFGIVLADADSSIIDANPAFCALLGYTVDDLRHMRYESFTHPEDLAIELELSAELVAGKRRHYQLDKRYLRRDGQYIWVRVTGSLIHDEDGSIRYGLVLVEDISEYRRIQQQAIELAVEREKVKLLTHFIQDAGHEFRTPLSIINTRTYLLRKLHDEPLRRETLLQSIEQQSDNIVRLVDGLVELARLESNAPLSADAIDLNALVRDVVVLMQTRAEQQQLSLHVELAADLPPLVGSYNELLLALREILDNAIRHSPDGSAVLLHTGKHDEHAEIEIRDSGEGITPADLPHIFKRFYRADTAHSTHGFGLGLAIVEKIIQRHNGEVLVDSRKGHGSRFVLRLPLVSAIC